MSFTHPHDPYVTRQKYWDLYQDTELPKLNVDAIAYEDQDSHSQRLYKAVDFENFSVDEQDVKNARRAYFGNISYLDEKIGKILQTLDDCQFTDDTTVVFCADHGDMLGERGLWYKMSFFEGSMQVPMIFSAPNKFKNKSIKNAVSILDLAPTLIEMAGGSLDQHPISNDGTSLYSCITQDKNPEHTVYAEYVGEGSIDPMLMIRQQQWKFNYCEVDEPQLFDLSKDPFEENNLAKNTDYADELENFTKQTHQRWNVEEFRAQVTLSQQQRLAVYTGLRKGNFKPWDFQPMQNANERYMRNHLDLNVLEANARFPKQK